VREENSVPNFHAHEIEDGWNTNRQEQDDINIPEQADNDLQDIDSSFSTLTDVEIETDSNNQDGEVFVDMVIIIPTKNSNF
jgi:hypothetical protein